jgi:hypothetical protein
MTTHSVSTSMAQASPTSDTNTTTTGQAMHTTETLITNPALPSQTPTLNSAIPELEPTPITTHLSTTLDTKGMNDGTVSFLLLC